MAHDVDGGLLPWLAALVGIGLAAGYLSTLFGIGGGLVVVPLLVYGLKVDFVTATAVSLCAIAIQTPVGLWTHARRNAVDWRLGAWLAGGGLFGVAVGHWLQPRVPVSHLKLLFALVMLVAAWRLWVRLEEGPVRPLHWGVLLGIGLVAGIASRLLGIGGGLLTVPLLVLLGVGVHRAVASSLVPVFTNALVATAVVATAAVLAQRSVDLTPAFPLALAAVVAAPFGTWTAHALAAVHLKRVFAVALALAASYIAATSGASA